MSLPSVRKYLVAFCLWSLVTAVFSPLYSFTPTGVAPAFFGPNALPIPDMSDGRVDEQLKLELAGDGYFGFNGDKTADLFARVSVPLFTRWANIALWMPVYEWYSQADGTGSGAGDVYIATNIQVLHNDWFKTEKARYIPQMTVRVGVKTASGEQFQRKRHFDSPGYFFDLAIGQTIPIRSINLRFAGSVGFLCWQTTEARQNDAVMYGLQAQLNHEYFSLQAEWGGYVGWERYGDAPMSIKVRAAGHIKGFEPFAQYQYGIKDYPFHQIRVGLAYRLPILKSRP